MSQIDKRIFVCDFETTVFEGQTDTRVWASACVEIGSENVRIFHSIDETFEFFKSLKTDIICYYHNLKFDGSFWIDYLLITLGFKQAYEKYKEDDINSIVWMRNHTMPKNSFKYSISDRGQWYTITIKTDNQFIEIRDSLKLLPFSVERIGKSFATKHKKLNMEYKGLRYPGCVITEEEKRYIANDVLVVKEALEIMFEEGHDRLTIGACCLAEYKKTVESMNVMSSPGKAYNELFPNLYTIKIDPAMYGSDNVGEYIRKSYKGGWCYLVKGKEHKVFSQGITADVNSLYPSMMSSESGCYYPTGLPKFHKINAVPDEWIEKDHIYFFVRIRTRFFIKKDRLPFIQIKRNLLYKSTEMLETSDIYDKDTDKYYSFYKDYDDTIKPAVVELTLTKTDWILLNDQYELIDLEILDACVFYARTGIFDEYISKYSAMKQVSTGARRELAKLFLNNLYGKMASSTDSSFKVAVAKDDHSVGFIPIERHDKLPGYIAAGSAITAHARNFTIRAAQQNYYGVDNPGFIYADTDSIHCDLLPEQLKGVPVHPSKFCYWKLESTWDQAIFVRQKTYIEHVVAENLQPVPDPFYNVRCAGMPEKCKQLFLTSMGACAPDPDRQYNEDEIEFLKTKRELINFNVGLKVPGKLMPKRVPGGLLLLEGFYEMR